MRVMSKICMTKDIGVSGNLFGGNILAWLDEAAAIYAHGVTGEKQMVTKHFENITFHLPVRCGEIVDIHCDEPVIGTTSVRFHVYGAVHKDLVFDTIAVFVAIDENGKKKEIVNKTSQWNG